MEYKILSAYGESIGIAIANLEEEVNYYCKLGWKVQGGVSIETEKNGYSICYTLTQAVITEIKEK